MASKKIKDSGKILEKSIKSNKLKVDKSIEKRDSYMSENGTIDFEKLKIIIKELKI